MDGSLVFVFILVVAASKCVSSHVDCGGIILLSDRDAPDADCSELMRTMVTRKLQNIPIRPQLVEKSDESIGDAECNGFGWRLQGRVPTCDCFFGWTGPQCEFSTPERNPRGAVVFLAYGGEKFVHFAADAARAMQTHFPALDESHTIIIFHDRHTDVSALSGLSVKTVEINIDFPESRRSEFSAETPSGGPCSLRGKKVTYGINFLHAIRWRCHLLLQHPALDSFDYVLSMDSDLRPVYDFPCDLFTAMARSRAAFGYIYKGREEESCCGKILKSTQRYCSDHERMCNDVAGFANCTSLLSGFHMFKLSFFREQSFQQYSRYIDELGIGYTHRVSSNVFFPLVMHILVSSPRVVHQFGGLGPFLHRGNELIWGPLEVDGRAVQLDDPFCPNEWICNELFECHEYAALLQEARNQYVSADQ